MTERMIRATQVNSVTESILKMPKSTISQTSPPNSSASRISPKVPMERCVAVSKITHPIRTMMPTTKCSGPSPLFEKPFCTQCANDQPLGLYVARTSTRVATRRTRNPVQSNSADVRRPAVAAFSFLLFMLRYSRVGLIALQKMNDPSEYWVSAATRLTGTRE